jgi:L-amino acid N-acyltransferase YncA
MRIRFATVEDVPIIVELGRSYHEATHFRSFDYQPDKVMENMRALIEGKRGTHCFFVAEDTPGQLIGGLIGCVENHLFSDQPVASILFYYVHPERRMNGAGMRLLAAFRRWAENRDALELCVGVNSGIQLKRVDRFLMRMGFRLTGGNYALPL